MYRKLILFISLTTFCTGLCFSGEGDVAHIGDTAPLISGVATDGSTVKMETYKGKVVLLGFFAMWCGGCVAEMPRVESEIYQPNKNAGLVVLEVGRGHTYSELAYFKQNHGFNFTILEDPRREIYNHYATDYIPRCYLIGKDGKVKYASTGLNEGDFSEMKRRIVQELAVNPQK